LHYDKNTNYFGVDISKDVFDVVDIKDQHFEFENSDKGYRSFKKILSANPYCIMEATGYHHLRLAYYLLDNNFKVSIVDPLSIKRFIQMKLSKVKTDKADARMIRLYGQSNELKLSEGAIRKPNRSIADQ
jgi:transposase